MTNHSAIPSKQCSDTKPGKYETGFMPRTWMFHKVCNNCDKKRYTPCVNCSTK